MGGPFADHSVRVAAGLASAPASGYSIQWMHLEGFQKL